MKEVKGFPKYTLSKEGKIYSKYTGKCLSPTKDITGYMVVTLVNSEGKFKKSVHRLLAETFIDNPEGKPQVNHIDGDKTNNSLNNLEWTTAKENSQHAVSSGLTGKRDAARYRMVAQYNRDTLEPIKIHKSLSSATKDTGVPFPNIIKVCKGQRKSAGGFFWSYL